MNSKTVDLIYLDPPFNSKADYAAPIGSAAAGAAFKDTWTLNDLDAEWIDSLEATEPHLLHVILAAMTASDKSYLVYMAMRLLEMRRLLKPTGSIYLHCDPDHESLPQAASWMRCSVRRRISGTKSYGHYRSAGQVVVAAIFRECTM